MRLTTPINLQQFAGAQNLKTELPLKWETQEDELSKKRHFVASAQWLRMYDTFWYLYKFVIWELSIFIVSCLLSVSAFMVTPQHNILVFYSVLRATTRLHKPEYKRPLPLIWGSVPTPLFDMDSSTRLLQDDFSLFCFLRFDSWWYLPSV